MLIVTEMTGMGTNQFYTCCCPVCRRCEGCRYQWQRKAGCLSICKSPHAFPRYYQIAEADLRPVVETMLLHQRVCSWRWRRASGGAGCVSAVAVHVGASSTIEGRKTEACTPLHFQLGLAGNR